MGIKLFNQTEFSAVFFDTLFGLVLFFNLDSFLDIKDPIHFIFYMFGIVLITHWWLAFKSSDDAFGEEVNRSVLDLVMGILYIIAIEYFILFAKDFQYQTALIFLVGLIGLDLIWAAIWKYIGKWKTSDQTKIASMEKELASTIAVDIIALILFLLVFTASFFLNSAGFLITFLISYCIYIYLTFKFKIIDIKFF